MSEPLNIEISKFQRSIGNNQSIATYQQRNGVVVQLWKNQELVYHDHLTYEEYAVYRADVPEYKLPDYAPPKITTNDSKETQANGNTIGRIVGNAEPSDVESTDYNPIIESNSRTEETNIGGTLEKIQLGLDIASMFPGVGTIAGGANTAISLARGNYSDALTSAAAMIPFAGTIIKGGALSGKAAAKLGKAAKKRGNGGKGKRNPRCLLRPYKINSKPSCPTPLTGHHVVPDRVFRLASGTRIPGGISNNDGLVICVQGKGRVGEHGRIHKKYDDYEKVIGLLGSPPGTAALWELEKLGARAVSEVTGCKRSHLEKQLRGYHASKGLAVDFIGRADPYGRLTKNIPVESVGSRSNHGLGPI
ncbi:hypothetical protein LJD21_01030 [Pseudomonas inefficax]|uniref:hypothetical protein n=1 Tax=Pseudomonas inefficax TaxID=2078786 RepID=UPI00207BBEF7|nr:hypothetical protein [Pseudomonas inefficax]MCM8910752.1 hypothetical protein [Pseudomonas inefficax]